MLNAAWAVLVQGCTVAGCHLWCRGRDQLATARPSSLVSPVELFALPRNQLQLPGIHESLRCTERRRSCWSDAVVQL